MDRPRVFFDLTDLQVIAALKAAGLWDIIRRYFLSEVYGEHNRAGWINFFTRLSHVPSTIRPPVPSIASNDTSTLPTIIARGTLGDNAMLMLRTDEEYMSAIRACVNTLPPGIIENDAGKPSVVTLDAADFNRVFSGENDGIKTEATDSVDKDNYEPVQSGSGSSQQPRQDPGVEKHKQPQRGQEEFRRPRHSERIQNPAKVCLDKFGIKKPATTLSKPRSKKSVRMGTCPFCNEVYNKHAGVMIQHMSECTFNPGNTPMVPRMPDRYVICPYCKGFHNINRGGMMRHIAVCTRKPAT